MIMHNVDIKGHEGTVRNPNSHVSGSVLWRSGLGSPLGGADPGAGKGTTPQFTIFPVSYSGHLKVSDKGEKSKNLFEAFSKQSVSPEYRRCIELGYSQSVICGKYAYADPSGLLSTYGPQLSGRIMLPLDLTTDEGPIYVNAKQYHGIIRRRISRAKAEAVNKALKVRKPFLHLSRHLHAVRRPRGSGGRFLNTKTPNFPKTATETGKNGSGNFYLSIDSQDSEVMQSDSGNFSSPSGANGRKTNLSGTEVTSMFCSSNLDQFSSNHLRFDKDKAWLVG